MEADERVQRPAMVAGRQVRGTGDRERRRGQELLDRQAIAQLAQGGFEDPAGVGLLDELHQRLDVIGKPYGPVHDLSPPVPLSFPRERVSPESYRVAGSCAAILKRPSAAATPARAGRQDLAPAGRSQAPPGRRGAMTRDGAPEPDGAKVAYARGG